LLTSSECGGWSDADIEGWRGSLVLFAERPSSAWVCCLGVLGVGRAGARAVLCSHLCALVCSSAVVAGGVVSPGRLHVLARLCADGVGEPRSLLVSLHNVTS